MSGWPCAAHVTQIKPLSASTGFRAPRDGDAILMRIVLLHATYDKPTGNHETPHVNAQSTNTPFTTTLLAIGSPLASLPQYQLAQIGNRGMLSASTM